MSLKFIKRFKEWVDDALEERRIGDKRYKELLQEFEESDREFDELHKKDIQYRADKDFDEPTTKDYVSKKDDSDYEEGKSLYEMGVDGVFDFGGWIGRNVKKGVKAFSETREKLGDSSLVAKVRDDETNADERTYGVLEKEVRFEGYKPKKGSSPSYDVDSFIINYLGIMSQKISNKGYFEDEAAIRRLLWNIPERFIDERKKDELLRDYVKSPVLFNLFITLKTFNKLNEILGGVGRLKVYEQVINDVITAVKKGNSDDFHGYIDVLRNIKLSEEGPCHDKERFALIEEWNKKLTNGLYKKYNLNKDNPRSPFILEEIRRFLREETLIDGIDGIDVENLYISGSPVRLNLEGDDGIRKDIEEIKEMLNKKIN